MKKFTIASSILLSALILSGCDSLGIPDMLAHDQVPDDVKARPRAIETQAPAMADESGWPRLGDVPAKPKDFSPKPVYNHYMNEMEFHRDEADAFKRQAQDEDLTIAPANAAPSSSSAGLKPPQLPPQLPGQ